MCECDLKGFRHIPLSEAKAGLITSSLELILLLTDDLIHHFCIFAESLGAAHQTDYRSVLQRVAASYANTAEQAVADLMS